MDDYRDILLSSYREKHAAHPTYSLRAFARDLKISPSRLSEVMAGKGHLSRQKAVGIATRLKFTPQRRQYFFDLIDVATARNESVRNQAEVRIKAAQAKKPEVYLPNTAFEPIATWQHIAVWSFLFLSAYDGDSQTIASSLKIDIIRVYEVLRQLEGANLIRETGGRWIPIVTEFSSGDDVPSSAIRKYHDSISAKGRESIEQQTTAERHLETLVLPFKSNRIGEIGMRIGDFVQSLATEFGEETDGDRVYALSLQFYGLSEKPKNPVHLV